ncbi:MAG: discoidin domain-containing protein [Janthinobacterium lividum]
MKTSLIQRMGWLLASLVLLSSPLLAQNLALGRATLASSSVQAASNAFDGNPGSRWESTASDPQYILVDLGSVQDIVHIRLAWETALGRDFTLSVSAVTAPPSDANWTNVLTGTWMTVQQTTGNTALSNDYSVRQSGRYVRLYGTARGTGFGYSLFEFEVYAYNPNPNLALGKTPTGVSSARQAAANAFDGNGTTRWESDYSDPQTLSVDLGSVQPIDDIRLTWEAAVGKDYTLEVSTDGTTWQTVAPVTGNASTTTEYAHLGASGRYVRLTGTARGTAYGYSLYEFEVFAASNNQVNLASGQPSFASSTQGAFPKNYAFDNDRLTRWSSTANLDNAFLYVDLQRTTTIGRVYLVWDQAYGGDFTLDVSDDATTWTTVSTAIDNSLHFNEFLFTTSVSGRYVRMNGTKRNTTIANTGYSLYEFQVNGLLTPLPVMLTHFGATAQLSGVAVSWATAREQHNASFAVQRSAEGVAFTTLGTVAGAGSTQLTHLYSYFDATPLRATGYYRLQQLDTDGTLTYSPVVVVSAAPTAPSMLSLYPNPTTGRATLSWEGTAATGRWYLTNSTGQVVHSEALAAPAGPPTLTLDLQPYPASQYVLTLEVAGQPLRRTLLQKID